MYKFVSFIPNGLTLCVAFFVFRKTLGKEVAVIFSIMNMTFLSSINYSHVIKMYSWCGFFVLMSFWQVYKILENDNKKDYVYFCLLTIASAYTHYYGLIAASFLYCFLIVMAFMKKIQLGNILVTSISAIIAYLPWSFVLFFLLCESKKHVGVFSHEEEHRRKYKIFFYWMIAGCTCVLGTTFAGLAISKLIRPFIMSRYLYVVSPLAWLAVSSFTFLLRDKRKMTVISITFFLLLTLPWMTKLYYSSAEKNIKTGRTVDIIKKNVQNGEMIYTDWREYAWSILAYYFPNNDIIHGDGVTHNEKIDLVYYVNDYHVMAAARDKGYECEKILSDGTLTDTNLIVYRVTNNK